MAWSPHPSSTVVRFRRRGPYPAWLPYAMAANLVIGALLAFYVTERAPIAWPSAEAAVPRSAPGAVVQVRQVIDGDTLDVAMNGQTVRVRLSQIDAPERDQPFGGASRSALARSLSGKAITLRSEGEDRYGRTLATVFADGQNINAALVRDGAAWAYRDYLDDPGLLLAERQARADGRGLWGSGDAIRPQDWRRTN